MLKNMKLIDLEREKMKSYQEFSKVELEDRYNDLLMQYNQFKNKNLSLNMARGKPGATQLSLSNDMLDVITSHDELGEYRNYGLLDGIDEAKDFFGDILNVSRDEIIVAGNSSLTLMFDQISRGYTHGYLGEAPWCRLETVKFICPVPGYDRHFAITEHFHIEMIPVPMIDQDLDVDTIVNLINSDPAIKGMWACPRYSNSTGYTFSKKSVEALAQVKPAANDFRFFWDNAYFVHHLNNDGDELLDLFAELKKYNNEKYIFEFFSTSKVTFPGSGVAVMACSAENKVDVLKHMNVQTIGGDKINQLRHVKYFKEPSGLVEHMKKHAALLKPKFDIVIKILNEKLKNVPNCYWTNPNGGYFISLFAPKGTAKKIVQLCKDAGVILTDAGAAYPYGQDPEDSHIRIAPSFPAENEIEEATKLLAICTELAFIETFL